MDTDEAIYGRYLNGDDEALDELLIRHKDGLTFFLMGYVRNQEDAEDLMMDTFALLLTKKPNFKGESSFKTWLYGIGRNLARNHIRKNAWLSFGSIEEKITILENSVEDNFLLGEENRKLYEALKNLKEEYRTTLYLSYFEKMNANEIALVMKKNVKQIYNFQARGKEQLRNFYEEDGGH